MVYIQLFCVFAFFSLAIRKIAVAINTDPIWRNLLFRFAASISSRGFSWPAGSFLRGFSSRCAGILGKLGRLSEFPVFALSVLVWREISDLSVVDLFFCTCTGLTRETVIGLATRISWTCCCWWSLCTQCVPSPPARWAVVDSLRLLIETSAKLSRFRGCLHSGTALEPSNGGTVQLTVCLLNGLIGLAFCSFLGPSSKHGRLKRLCVDLGIVLNRSRLSNKLDLAKEIRRSSLSI